MKFINVIIDTLKSKDAFLSFFGAFFGAFFAFYFLILFEKIKDKKTWRKTVKTEHIYLERYFNDLLIYCDKNLGLLNSIITNFKNRKLDITNLRKFPIREDITMRLNNIDFINKVYILIVDIVSFNDDVDTLNSWREKINDSIDKYIFELKRKELEPHISNSVEMFIKNSDLLSNFLKLLKNKIINLMAENRLLLD